MATFQAIGQYDNDLSDYGNNLEGRSDGAIIGGAIALRFNDKSRTIVNFLEHFGFNEASQNPFAIREKILEILQVRFNEVPDEVGETLEDIGGIPTLRELFRRAISIESIAEFQQLLRDPDCLSS
jgi:hypothetical protein